MRFASLVILVIYENDHNEFVDDNHGDDGIKDHSHEDEYYLSGVEINTSMWFTLILMNESFPQDQTQGVPIIAMIRIILNVHVQFDRVDKRGG